MQNKKKMEFIQMLNILPKKKNRMKPRLFKLSQEVELF